MENIKTLINTYSGIVKTLQEIEKSSQDIQDINRLRSENKSLKQENTSLKKAIEWNENHIRILSHALGQKICPDCGGEGGFDDGHGSGGPCETCSTSGLV